VSVEYVRDGAVVRVASEQRAGRVYATVDGEEIVLESVAIDARHVRIVTADGRHLRAIHARNGARILVALGGRVVELAPHAADADDGDDRAGGFTPEVTAPMPGKVLEVLVAVGDEVAHDDPLVRLEAMKMEQTIRATSAARVREVRVEVGTMVGPGAVLLVLDREADEEKS
jgi:biotin carboxyl carrier protein